MTQHRHTRSLLKWAGNKYRVLDRLKKWLPKPTETSRFIEPFMGSGSVFLNTDYSRYLLNDINLDLINFYRFVQTEQQTFIDYCHTFFDPKYNTSENYYMTRDVFNATDDLRLKAALFLYINRHGFNGLCRYNRQGGLNVPYGKMKKPYFPEKEMLYFIAKMKNAKLYCIDFATMFTKAKPGDVIYCDPPYVPLTKTASFTDYSVAGFDMQQQEKLASLAEKSANKGVSVVISNHNTPVTRKLYCNARCYKIEVQRTISCDGGNRNVAKELIAVYKAGSMPYA
jgi:DNA adenine methylase